MNVEEILYKLQDQGLLRLSKISGDYFQIYCPIHNDGNEKKPSCGVLLHEQVRNGVTYPDNLLYVGGGLHVCRIMEGYSWI